MSIFIPVVKDTYYETTLDTLDYKILLGGFTVFEGRAVKGPEGTLKINVNKIFKDYIENKITDFREVDGGVIAHPEAFRIFELRDSSDTLLETYGVLFDWDKEWNGETALLSDPVRPSISQQMKFPISIYSPNGQTEIIDPEPITKNTYFRPLWNPIVIDNYATEVYYEWETDYRPISDIIPTASIEDVVFRNQTSTGVIIRVGESPYAYEDREFSITFTYNGEVIGEVQVIQRALDLGLITKTLTVPSTGGEYTIQWKNDRVSQYSRLSASAPQWPGTTMTNPSFTGATVNIPANTSYEDHNFTIEYYYEKFGSNYKLDETQVTIQGKTGGTSGDTGTTTGVTIETGVTRDLVITDDKVFAGFATPTIQVWGESFAAIKDNYYLEPSNLYRFSNLDYNGGLGLKGVSTNIPLCSYSIECPPTERTNSPLVEFDGYALSGSTQWLNDLLIEAKVDICRDGIPGERYIRYEGESPRVATLYLLSGSTVLCENTVVQLPNGYKWYNGDPVRGSERVLKTVTPYTFSDLKFKTSSFNEETLRTYLQTVIPVYTHFDIRDGVYVPIVDNVFLSSFQKYDTSAFEFEQNGEWVTVKTPMPINVIMDTSGLSATDIWISKNVRYIYGSTDATLTAVTYAGTVQDFRNVICNVNRINIPTVQCLDGISYTESDLWDKSDPIAYIGNQIRPSFCSEYFYQTDEPTIGNSITITFTGSTIYTVGIDQVVIGKSGRWLTPVDRVEGSDGEYATLTLTFDEEVIGIRSLSSFYRQVSDNILYYGPYKENRGGRNIAVPSVKMRAMNGYVYSGNTIISGTYENNNLKFIKGTGNFAGTNITTLKAPNLLSITDSALTDSNIEEFYIPSIQWIGTDALPATTTKVTVGKNFSSCSQYAFRKATLLTSLRFNGSVQEWEKLIEFSYNLKISLSNITTVYCDNGEWTPQ